MFGSLGFQEILVICVILIIVVGPERLPNLMKGVGKTVRSMREASREIRSTVGIDEMLRDDVMRPVPPRPRPSATVARAAALPASSDAVAGARPAAEPASPSAEPTAANAAPAPPAAPPAASSVPPPPPPAGVDSVPPPAPGKTS
jgi:sec-independent protein translocase protein TatB